MSNHVTGHDPLVDWLRQHATALDGLDPCAPLDDLEPLREIVGSAKVVAIGENSHYIREFSLLRHRVLWFLVQRCGFNVHAFEFGFSEGFAVQSWVQGHGQPDDLEQLVGATMPCPTEVRATLRWLREHNHTAATPVRFVGVDVPQAGGSLLPCLRPLTEFLTEVDPDALPLLEAAVGIADRIKGASMPQSAPAWARPKAGITSSTNSGGNARVSTPGRDPVRQPLVTQRLDLPSTWHPASRNPALPDKNLNQQYWG